MNTNSYFTIQVLKAGNVWIRINNATGEETPGTIYYWVNSVPNAARDNYDGSIVPTGSAQYILVNGSNPAVGTIIRLYRPETTACCFGDGADNGSYIQISGTAETKVYGNMASLIGFSETLPNAAFRYMFYSSNIVDASELELPWTTLADYCFIRLFFNNQKLTKPPYLPATTLATYCYTYMFRSCTALKTIAKMGIETIVINNWCNEMYALTGIETVTIPKFHFNNGRLTGMFRNCTSLKTVTVDTYDEALPNNAYQHLFRGCTGLETITCKAKSFSSNTWADWLLDASATGAFIKDKDTTWTTGNSGIPSGWTIKNANQNTQFLDFSSANRIMYNGNNHIKCIYGPNNQLLWTEEPYFTVEASGSGNIQLRIDNTGTATQATPAVIYYWKNVEPNAARDNYTGTLTADTTDVGTNKVTYVNGDVIKMWRAEQTAFGYGLNNTNYLIGGANCIVYGNVASLVNYVSVMPEFCFERMFYYTGITDFSGLIIPWDTISRYGLHNFIYGGAQIYSESQLPFFPATTVNNYGYNRLIRALANLTSIDMTKHFCCKYAGKEAFSQMFIDTKLQSIKVKWDIEPIDSTSTRIFSQLIMKDTVANITNLDPNPTSTKYANWITDKAAVGIFTKATGANWDSGVNGIPTGWTVVEV